MLLLLSLLFLLLSLLPKDFNLGRLVSEICCPELSCPSHCHLQFSTSDPPWYASASLPQVFLSSFHLQNKQTNIETKKLSLSLSYSLYMVLCFLFFLLYIALSSFLSLISRIILSLPTTKILKTMLILSSSTPPWWSRHHQECRGGTCVDPCDNFTECGTNAQCYTVNHLPTCRCPEVQS